MRYRHRSRGAALLTAMLTVTLVATFAAAALWQQWRSVEVETAERDRLQAAWVLSGALDWARLILREDGRSGGADHLAEPWAVPLEEARLSSFLAADKNNNSAGTEDALDAFLSGQITDLQSRLNVRNLVDSGKVSETGLAAFTKLFELLGLPTEPLPALALALVKASEPTGQSAPLMPQHVSQLVWFGLPPSTIAAIAPYVTVLPSRTTVNLNTASAPVIYASAPALEIADAQRLVAARTRAHFRSLADAANAAGLSSALFADGQQGYASRFFEVRGTLRLAQTIVEERSLVQRDGLNVITLWRERIARDPQAPSSQNPP
jgi:general secretion pathway protein K